MKRREFLQQAHTYKGKMDVAGWYVSEKLDGFRMFWDGGLSRGQRVGDVPYAAKVIVKSGKDKPCLEEKATGLWSRYANPIFAPDWFIDQLPSCLMDGEVWAGRGNFKLVSKCVKKRVPVDSEWEEMQYKVYGSPTPSLMFMDGHCKNTNIDLTLNTSKIMDWIRTLPPSATQEWAACDGNFAHELAFLDDQIGTAPGALSIHKQIELPADQEEAKAELMRTHEAFVAKGAEGSVVRNPDEVWRPKRNGMVLKVKPYKDMEATVVGFTSGEETEKGSKLLGLIGALIVRMEDGGEFNLSGFTHDERTFYTESMSEHAEEHPGEVMPEDFAGSHFKVGDVVTFKYLEIPKGGLPREARYFRHREVV